MAELLAARMALVTGATRGLGRAVALHLASCGARVAVHGRSTADAQRVVDEIEGAGGSACAVAADLADPDGPQALIDQVDRQGAPIDILVTCAVDQSLTPLADPDLWTWRRIMEVNLLAQVSLTRIVCAGQEVEPVSVVHVASVEALAPFPGHAAYAASKAALVSLVTSAAREFAPARVNAVLPGLIDRPGLAESWPEGHADWLASAPLHRTVEAGEVAAAVAFLASNQASGITGIALPVDAGWSSASRVSWG